MWFHHAALSCPPRVQNKRQLARRHLITPALSRPSPTPDTRKCSHAATAVLGPRGQPCTAFIRSDYAKLRSRKLPRWLGVELTSLLPLRLQFSTCSFLADLSIYPNTATARLRATGGPGVRVVTDISETGCQALGPVVRLSASFPGGAYLYVCLCYLSAPLLCHSGGSSHKPKQRVLNSLHSKVHLSEIHPCSYENAILT